MYAHHALSTQPELKGADNTLNAALHLHMLDTAHLVTQQNGPCLAALMSLFLLTVTIRTPLVLDISTQLQIKTEAKKQGVW